MLFLALGGYLLVIGATVSTFGWVWDDRAFLAGPRPPLGEWLRLAWTSDFWALASEDARHASGMFRPVTSTTHAVERAIFGESPGLAHVVNLLIHAATALLTGLLARRLGGAAWVAAGFVLLHPHANELLGMVAGRTDALAAVFILGALLLGPASVAGDEPGGRRLLRGTAAGACVALACLAKEIGFVAPGLWILVDVLRGGRDPRRWIAPVVGAAVAAAIRVAALGSAFGEHDPGGRLDVIGGLASTGWAFADSLVAIPTAPWPPPHAAAGGLLVLVGAIVLGVAGRRWGAWFAVAWVVIAWAPMADWTGLGIRSSRALLYVPIIGLALGIARLPVWERGSRGALAVAGVVGLLFAGLQGWSVSRWGSEEVLWQASARQNPDSPVPWLNLGRAQIEGGDLVGGRYSYMQAAALSQRARDAAHFVSAATALGTMAMNEGDLEGARVFLQDAVEVAGAANARDAVALLEEVERRLLRPD